MNFDKDAGNVGNETQFNYQLLINNFDKNIHVSLRKNKNAEERYSIKLSGNSILNIIDKEKQIKTHVLTYNNDEQSCFIYYSLMGINDFRKIGSEYNIYDECEAKIFIIFNKETKQMLFIKRKNLKELFFFFDKNHNEKKFCNKAKRGKVFGDGDYGFRFTFDELVNADGVFINNAEKLYNFLGIQNV